MGRQLVNYSHNFAVPIGLLLHGLIVITDQIEVQPEYFHWYLDHPRPDPVNFGLQKEKSILIRSTLLKMPLL